MVLSAIALAKEAGAFSSFFNSICNGPLSTFLSASGIVFPRARPPGSFLNQNAAGCRRQHTARPTFAAQSGWPLPLRRAAVVREGAGERTYDVRATGSLEGDSEVGARTVGSGNARRDRLDELTRRKHPRSVGDSHRARHSDRN